jgi:hypothetical protein
MEKDKSDKSKLLDMFRYWCFGTFIIIFAAVTVYIGLFVSWSEALSRGLPIWGLVAVICLLWYFIYRWYLNRKP